MTDIEADVTAALDATHDTLVGLGNLTRWVPGASVLYSVALRALGSDIGPQVEVLRALGWVVRGGQWIALTEAGVRAGLDDPLPPADVAPRRHLERVADAPSCWGEVQP